jgi:hypothetical protein
MKEDIFARVDRREDLSRRLLLGGKLKEVDIKRLELDLLEVVEDYE